jgi:hypothetical protein
VLISFEYPAQTDLSQLEERTGIPGMGGHEKGVC